MPRPKGAEVWLDGGHNPHGAAAVSRAMADLEEHGERPLYLICGMLRTKDAVGFLRAFRGLARHVVTVAIPARRPASGAGALYDRRALPVWTPRRRKTWKTPCCRSRPGRAPHPQKPPPRILICGSLYLAGKVLAENS